MVATRRSLAGGSLAELPSTPAARQKRERKADPSPPRRTSLSPREKTPVQSPKVSPPKRSPSPVANGNGHSARKQRSTDTDEEEAKQFGGTLGVTGVMLFSHVLMYYLWIALEFHQGGLHYPKSLGETGSWVRASLDVVMEKAFPTAYACKIYFTFMGLETFLSWFMPGPVIKGLPVPSEGNIQHSYLCNGLTSWYATILIGAVLHFTGVWPLTELADNFGPVMSVAIISGNVLSLIIYLAAHILGKVHRPSGSVIYDFFIGIYLNPRIKHFDFKMWGEIRVSWMLLFFLTASAACKQYALHGVVTGPMWFMVLAHFLYTNACQKGEECIPTTWDIFYENWGWMLIFWNVAGVPFVYCFQSYYILKNDPVEFHPLVCGTLFTVLALAYYIWDTANSQKNRFRMQLRGTFTPRKTFPQLPWGTLSNPKYLKTACGSTLLIDGWWGQARKIHYTADITMALCWGLACGLKGFLPYFYVLFFVTFLTHRVLRDMERCRKKYGADWDEYCRIVPYIFIPGVY